LISNINEPIEKVKGLIFRRLLSEPPLSLRSILLRRQSNLLPLGLARRIRYDI
jgi:hypothetical protein